MYNNLKALLFQEKKNKFYQLKEALYGLKQAPRAWNSRLDSYLTRKGFLKCTYEHSIYTKEGGNGEFTIVCVYVDDLLYTGNSVCTV